MKLDKDFKEAISHLPSKEKDKLIFRLLRRDYLLANRLHFELLSEQSIDERRGDMEKIVVHKIKEMTARFYSPGCLLMDLRYLSGDITEHVKITKDKFGEASLNLLMLNKVIPQNLDNIAQYSLAKTNKLCVYIIARAFKIVILIDRLDKDYFIEFKDNLIQLGQHIGQSDHLMRTAIHHGFDVNWLLLDRIPDDIQEIHKDLRAQGYLR